jgi:hypothetical protein
MDSALSSEAAAQILANQKIYKKLEIGKNPDYLVKGLARANVITLSIVFQPPLVKTKHIFVNLLTDIEPKDSHPKRRCLPQCESLGELIPNGVYSYPKPNSSKPTQFKPKSFLTECHVAETGDANSDHLSSKDDEETNRIPRPVTPHIFQTDPALLHLTATSKPFSPKDNQQKSSSPPPSENQTQPQPESQNQSPPENQP